MPLKRFLQGDPDHEPVGERHKLGVVLTQRESLDRVHRELKQFATGIRLAEVRPLMGAYGVSKAVADVLEILANVAEEMPGDVAPITSEVRVAVSDLDRVKVGLLHGGLDVEDMVLTLENCMFGVIDAFQKLEEYQAAPFGDPWED